MMNVKMNFKVRVMRHVNDALDLECGLIFKKGFSLVVNVFL